MSRLRWNILLRPPSNLLALGFGAGFSPRAPGTVGTLVAVPIYLMLAQLTLELYVLCVFVATVAGVWICDRANASLGGTDHSAIVWDEICGYLIAMTALPATWPWMLAAFVLFRLLDIRKPGPVRWAERNLPRGVGVMGDDVVAGLLTLGLLHVVAGVL